MSCFIIRLLQMVDHLELAPDALPLDCLPPVEWKNDPCGRKAVEKVVPNYIFATYCKVSPHYNSFLWAECNQSGI